MDAAQRTRSTRTELLSKRTYWCKISSSAKHPFEQKKADWWKKMLGVKSLDYSHSLGADFTTQKISPVLFDEMRDLRWDLKYDPWCRVWITNPQIKYTEAGFYNSEKLHFTCDNHDAKTMCRNTVFMWHSNPSAVCVCMSFISHSSLKSRNRNKNEIKGGIITWKMLCRSSQTAAMEEVIQFYTLVKEMPQSIHCYK